MEKIINYSGVEYIVSDDGHVYSTKNVGCGKYHKEIKQRLNNDGYYEITVGNNSKRRKCGVHRLVALAFLPNPDNLPEVNHKNYVRTDNRAENLEWISHYDNIAYSVKNGNFKHFGKDNPNYGNTVLKERYAKHPELAETLARHRGDNGKAKRIVMYDLDNHEQHEFSCMVDCAEYLILNSYIRGKKLYSVAAAISKCASSSNLYYKRFKFWFID